VSRRGRASFEEKKKMAEILPRTCAYYRALFGPYIEGTIDAQARRELAAHLAECRECASIFGLEWKASLEEKGGGAPGRKGGRPTGLPFTLPFLRGGGRKSTFVLLAVSLGAILVLSRMGGRASLSGGEGTPAPKVMEETAELLKSQRRLNDALVQVALERRTPVPGKVKFQALEVLRKVREALISGKGGKKALAGLLHPLFRIEEMGPGGMVERTLDKAALLADPGKAEDLLEADQFQWWSAGEGSVSLYSFGSGTRGPAFFLLLKDQGKGWRLYWVLRKAR